MSFSSNRVQLLHDKAAPVLNESRKVDFKERVVVLQNEAQCGSFAHRSKGAQEDARLRESETKIY